MWVNPSIGPSIRGQLMKMFITLEPHGILWSTFANICMSTILNHWHAKPPFWWMVVCSTSVHLLWLVSETSHNSWNFLDVWIIHTYLHVFQYCPVQQLECKMVTRFGSIMLAGWGILVNAHNSWCILIKFCILVHFNIIETQVCIIVTMAGIFYKHRPRPTHGTDFVVSI